MVLSFFVVKKAGRVFLDDDGQGSGGRAVAWCRQSVERVWLKLVILCHTDDLFELADRGQGAFAWGNIREDFFGQGAFSFEQPAFRDSKIPADVLCQGRAELVAPDLKF